MPARRLIKLKFWWRHERRPGEAKDFLEAGDSTVVRTPSSEKSFNEAWASAVATARIKIF